jgi:adenylosuccinate lyase
MIERYSLKEISAIWSDEEKFSRFLKIEQYLCEALEKRKEIPQGVSKAFDGIKINVKQIQKIEEKTHHDIIAFLKSISPQLGKAAQYLHLGMTSSDLLDTTLAWQIKDATALILSELDALIIEVKKQAKEHKKTVCMARTHGVHAEIYTLGLKFLYFYNDLVQERKLLADSMDYVAAGKISGAVGTFAHLDPLVEEYICKKIGITNALVSTQIVSRERVAYYLSIISLIGASIERFSTEIRHLHRTEVNEVQEPFYEGQKGSSAMPHKQNPVICERMCGLARLLRGNMQVAYENINLWHERDISHSSNERVILPDSTMAIYYMLKKFILVIRDLRVHPKNSLRNMELSKGIVYSQKILLKLMDRGIGRMEAYDMVQAAALRAINKNTTFEQEIFSDGVIGKYLKPEEIKGLFDPHAYLANVDKIYKRFKI